MQKSEVISNLLKKQPFGLQLKRHLVNKNQPDLSHDLSDVLGRVPVHLEVDAAQIGRQGAGRVATRHARQGLHQVLTGHALFVPGKTTKQVRKQRLEIKEDVIFTLPMT